MRIWMLPLMLAMLLGAGCGQGTSEETAGAPAAGPASSAPEAEGTQGAALSAHGKKVVMIIAHRDFRDEELFKPREVLEQAGAKVTIASSAPSPARGVFKATVKPDLLLKDLNPADYDAVVFVGGPGAKEYWEDDTAHQVARRAAEMDKVLGAICIAPVTLANAGVLKEG